MRNGLTDYGHFDNAAVNAMMRRAGKAAFDMRDAVVSPKVKIRCEGDLKYGISRAAMLLMADLYYRSIWSISALLSL
jgi:hypothetical protein